MANGNPQDRPLFENRIFDEPRATYESLANSLPLSLLIKDLSGRRLFANQAYLDLRGTTLDELYGKRDEDLFPPEIARAYTEDDRQVLATGQSLHNVEQTRDASGRLIWIERVKSRIVDLDGRVIGIQLLFWDVTNRVIAEKNLDRERYFLTTLLDNIPDSIYFKDNESRFLRISAAMARKFGFETADEVVGRTDADIFTAEHAQAARRDELEIIRTGEPLVDRIERETWPDREDSWCQSTKMPLRNDSGKVIGTFGISRDITELKASQDALRAALEEAAQASRAKSDFLANMSHEIRTPMNAIIGMAGLLGQTEMTREQRDYVDLIGQSADSLLGLLNDILDFSKIEARKLELECIPFSVRDLIGRTGQTLALRASEKGLELVCRVAPDVPDRLQGDPCRLRQILINLISNAIKFTDRGEVAVDVSRADQDIGAGLWLSFTVQDSGIGIPEDKQAAVLEAFTQADSSTTRRFGGTGLGLTISKQLVALMAGTLELESEPGVGTTFRFTIPLEPTASQGVDPTERLMGFVDLPVLVVDDNATNRRILKEIFASWNFQPTVVDSGRSAIREFRRADSSGIPYRLVVLDCMMPEMDGFEVAREIRPLCERAESRMIMLSSANRAGDAKRCNEVGISRYLTKPVVQSELLETILQVMDVAQPPRPVGSGDSRPTCPPLRVLVAEDGLANQQVAIGLLRAAGHEPVLAADGQAAVELWSREPLDMILMDVHMPVMDGLEATKAIRRRECESGEHIPIIALTAAAMPEDAAACRAAGMDDYLAKPIHPDQLQATMCKHAPVDAKNTAVGPPAPTAEPCVAGSPPALPDGIPAATLPDLGSDHDSAAGTAMNSQSFSALDPHAACERVAGGEEGVRLLAAVFTDESRQLMEILRQKIPAGDVQEIQRAAHTLKGSARLFSAERVEQAASLVEAGAKQGQLVDATEAMPELEQAVAEMLHELEILVGNNSEGQ